MLGRCLCEQVEFEITGKIPNFYQCHCSQCRQVTGSSSNTGMFMAKDAFRWTKGEDKVTSYVKDSGYNSCFCSNCGSALPNPVKSIEGYCIPAGLLDGEIECKVAAHLYVGSKASWDLIADDGIQYAEMPDIQTLNEVLQRS